MNFLRFLVELIRCKERAQEDKRNEDLREARMKAVTEALRPPQPPVEAKTRKKRMFRRKRRSRKWQLFLDLSIVDILPIIRELDERGVLAPLAVAEDSD